MSESESESEGSKRPASFEAKRERLNKRIKELTEEQCGHDNPVIATKLTELKWDMALSFEFKATSCGFLVWLASNNMGPRSYQERCLTPKFLGPSVGADVRERVAMDMFELGRLYGCTTCAKLTKTRHQSIAAGFVRMNFSGVDVRIAQDAAENDNLSKFTFLKFIATFPIRDYSFSMC